MERNQRSDDTGSSERAFAEENMDRAGQAGLEGAFDAEPGLDPDRRQMEQDAREAFGGSAMDQSQSSDDTGSSERAFAEENMDRAGQAGLEGAFDAEPGLDPDRRQMEQDAREAFGGSAGGSSDS